MPDHDPITKKIRGLLCLIAIQVEFPRPKLPLAPDKTAYLPGEQQPRTLSHSGRPLSASGPTYDFMIGPATLHPSIIQGAVGGKFRARKGVAGTRGAMAGQWSISAGIRDRTRLPHTPGRLLGSAPGRCASSASAVAGAGGTGRCGNGADQPAQRERLDVDAAR